MAERDSEEHPEAGGPVVADEPASATRAAPPTRRSRGGGPWLVALLIVVVAGVASAPFWAPAVVSLLPWGTQEDAAAERTAALAARVAALEKRAVPPAVDLGPLNSAQDALARRVEQLESGVNSRLAELEKRPAAPAGDDEATKSALNALAGRVDRLESAGNAADRLIEGAVAAEKAALQQLEQRLAALEAQSASGKADFAAALQDLRQEIARVDAGGAELAKRLAALEREAQSQSPGQLRADAMLALLLAQMREAVDQARPFPAEYNAFTSLAHDPGLAAAAEPLHEAARNGVPSRAVLAKRLADLSRPVAAAGEPAAEPDWGARTLARLRGLITIRRIDGGAQSGPEAAVGAAQIALARGDLAGAVAALEPLTGAAAEAVRSWLQMARERLAVESALDRLQELLTVRLGNRVVEPAPPPRSVPEEPSEKTRAPS
jgi:hypothetical protein